jgi:hypothetical protein
VIISVQGATSRQLAGSREKSFADVVVDGTPRDASHSLKSRNSQGLNAASQPWSTPDLQTASLSPETSSCPESPFVHEAKA